LKIINKRRFIMRERVQSWGGFLASMVVPNIGAFIAWGLITALFIATGWLPNATFSKLVSPMILYLLPILIGYTGGKIVHGHRGGVIGAVATMGAVVGTTVPMFLGAMIMGFASGQRLPARTRDTGRAGIRDAPSAGQPECENQIAEHARSLIVDRLHN
jgi:PTS system mannitol-specific IIC component